MLKVHEDELAQLFENARSSSRKRVHLQLHSSHQEPVQRLLIALVKGSYVEPHFHALPHQWEMFTILKGEVLVKTYNKDGGVVDETTINSFDPIPLVEIKPGVIHSLKCISENALILEVKEGPFDEAHAKIFPCFSVDK